MNSIEKYRKEKDEISKQRELNFFNSDGIYDVFNASGTIIEDTPESIKQYIDKEPGTYIYTKYNDKYVRFGQYIHISGLYIVAVGIDPNEFHTFGNFNMAYDCWKNKYRKPWNINK